MLQRPQPGIPRPFVPLAGQIPSARSVVTAPRQAEDFNKPGVAACPPPPANDAATNSDQASSNLAPAQPDPVVVDFERFRQEIIIPGGQRAEQSYRDWLARADKDPRYLAIQKFIHRHRHERLFTLTLEEVERVTIHPDPNIRTGHALGELRPGRDCIKEVDDFDTPWTYVYILHGMLEKTGQLPRWEDFQSFMKNEAFDLYYKRFAEHFDTASKSREEVGRLWRALQWRVGNGYYSFLREVDLLTRLRVQYNLPVRYHLLADAQYKIDLWCGNVLVAIFIKNTKFRQGMEGRKSRVGAMMDISGFRTLELELDAPLRFGRPSLVTPEYVKLAADTIRAAMEGKE